MGHPKPRAFALTYLFGRFSLLFGGFAVTVVGLRHAEVALEQFHSRVSGSEPTPEHINHLGRKSPSRCDVHM